MKKSFMMSPQIQSWPKIYDFLCEYFYTQNLNKSDVFKLAVSCEEIFANIIHHSRMPDSKNVKIILDYEPNLKVATITFEYGGIEFNVEEACFGEFVKLDSTGEPGGMGLFILKKFADKIKYFYSDSEKKNILIITRKIA